ncbi:unnamed protein product [Ectocarpus sp. 6 AP-2014]
MAEEGLVQFLVLAKGAKGAACVALIQQVLSNKKLFVFGELLAMPNVQALAGTPHEPHLRLLETFAYGTYADAQAKADQLPKLTGAQVDKLRMLSVVSLAHTSKVVPYAAMKTALGIDSIRRLEDVIFDTMYAGLLQGKLDQRQAVLKVKYAMARDVRVDELTIMIDKLGSWASTTQVLLETLEGSVTQAAESRKSEAQIAESLAAEAAEVKKNFSESTGKQRDDDGFHDVGFDMEDRSGGMRRGRSKRNRAGMDFRPRNK